MQEEVSNKKNFNKYIFLSTLSRYLIETFIGTILFKAGFPLRNILFYYLMVNIFSFILGFICIHISKKYSNKLLAIIGVISFITLQITLNKIYLNYWYLILIAFLYSLYRRNYWISRRYYTLQVIPKNNISKDYSILSIFNQLAIIAASYIGAILLEYVSITIITIISIILLFISIYFIYKLKIKHEKNDTKLNLLEMIKSVPISSIIHIGCYELQTILTFLVPLYIIIYINNTYISVGIINILTQLSTILFIYIYGRLINKNKNYLKFSIIFLIIFKILQINTIGLTLYIVTFISGLASKMYEQSFNKEILTLSKNFEFHNYNLFYEFVQNLFRTIIVLIIFIFIKDIKIMIYFTLAAIILSLLFKFNTTPRNNKSKVMWKKQ